MSEYSPTGFFARFEGERSGKRTTYFSIPVARFTDDGEPLVFAPELSNQRLVPAGAIENFHDIHPEERSQTNGHRLIGAVSARPGWFVKTQDTVNRVEAWGVLDNGELVPIDDVPIEGDGRTLEMHWLDDDVPKDKPYFTIHRQDPAEG